MEQAESSGRSASPASSAASRSISLRALPETRAQAVVWAHAAEIEEVRTNEEGCVLNLNDPETMNRAISGES